MMKWFYRIALAGAALVLALYIGIWALSPALVRHLANEYLHPFGISVSDDSRVRLNLFTSRLAAHNLALLKAGQTTFSLGTLELDYSLWRIFAKELRIKKIRLDNARIPLSRSAEALTIAGIVIPETTTEEAEPSADAAPSSSFDWPLEFNSIRIDDVAFVLENEGHAHAVTIESIHVDKTRYANSTLRSQIQARLNIDGAALSMQTDIEYHPSRSHITLALSGSGIDPAPYHYLFADAVDALDAAIDFTLDVTLDSQQSGFALQSPQASVTVRALDAQAQGLRVQLGELNLNLQQTSLEYGDALRGQTQLDLDLSDFDSQVLATQATLAKLTKLHLPQLHLQVNERAADAKAERLELQGLLLSQVKEASGKSLPALLTLDTLTLSGVNLDEQMSTIGAVHIGALEARLVRNAQGELANIVALPPTSSARGEAETPEPAASPAPPSEDLTEQMPYRVAVETLVLDAPANIHLRDNSVAPVLDKTMILETLSVGRIDTADASNFTEFSAQLRDTAYFKQTLTGKAQLFGEKANFDLESSGSQLALNELSPYVAEALGFQILAGQLDSTLHVSASENALDGSTTLILRGAEFSSDKTLKSETDVIGQSAIPLNVALGMLKDKEGNIKLKIPLSGDVNDPSFGVQYLVGLVVKKAVMQQTKKHLINTFVPYGQVLSIALAAGSYALKVRFEDLVYAPRQIELGAEQQTYLDSFVALMKDKRELQVKLCPIATLADLSTSTSAGDALDEQQREALRNLATQRAAHFKARAVRDGIDSARMLLCNPVIDDRDNAQPSLMISL